MGRLIDVDALLRNEIEDEFGVNHVLSSSILAAPTIDAEPVRHGYWIPMYEEVEKLTAEGWQMVEVQTAWKCSLCGREEIAGSDEMPYCHCGAKMMREDYD